jgi:5-oxopent-3-ene-1,2,5-tricarboxylate decarboxylase / 2-hydroxyhepta-2,4-diene-1,7-dioate isomerase
MTFALRTVVGAMFEFQSAWDAAAETMAREPHHRPPKHPVLYIKPANTWRTVGQSVLLPSDVNEVQVGATLGVAFARTAARVDERDALDYVAGYCIVNDVTVPHSSLLRPPMKQKCRDGFCPIGPCVPASFVADPSALEIRSYVEGVLLHTANTATLRRSVARLIADVSDFMSLAPGDLLLVGVPHGVPLARAGQRMAIEIDGLGRLENMLEREPALEGAVA